MSIIFKKILTSSASLMLILSLLLLCACTEKFGVEKDVCTNHSFTKTTVKAATCTEEGLAKEKCYICGHEQEVALPISSQHNFIEMGSTVTCTNDGKITFECSQCGLSKEEERNAFGHSWILATCLEEKHCSICGVKEGGKASHSFVGEKCSVCGVENTKTIMLGDIKFIVPNSIELTNSTTKFKINIENIDYDLNVWYSVECLSNTQGFGLGFNYSLSDSNGYVIASGTEYALDLNTGEKARNQAFRITSNTPGSLEWGKTYKLKLTSNR